MGLYGALLVGPYLLAVLCFPTYALALFYGKHSAYLSLGDPLRLMCCSYVFLYVGLLLSSILNALGRPTHLQWPVYDLDSVGDARAAARGDARCRWGCRRKLVG